MATKQQNFNRAEKAAITKLANKHLSVTEYAEMIIELRRSNKHLYSNICSYQELINKRNASITTYKDNIDNLNLELNNLKASLKNIENKYEALKAFSKQTENELSAKTTKCEDKDKEIAQLKQLLALNNDKFKNYVTQIKNLEQKNRSLKEVVDELRNNIDEVKSIRNNETRRADINFRNYKDVSTQYLKLAKHFDWLKILLIVFVVLFILSMLF